MARDLVYQPTLPNFSLSDDPTYDDNPRTRRFRRQRKPYVGPRQRLSQRFEALRQSAHCEQCLRQPRKLYDHVLVFGDVVPGRMDGTLVLLCGRCLDKVCEIEAGLWELIRPCCCH
jgi:hypothetical protein